MEDLLIGLAKDSPWIALTLFLLHRVFKRETAVLEAYKSGAESQNSMAAAIESLERSTGSVQQTLVRIEAQLAARRDHS